jgi:UDP-N-acetylglucosamine--N-acetylmuramyl-(pentapeptide) pyrophosphoryl-undecaprenol N-acetylglucosamine transferase
MANRMLGKIVDQVYISIPGSEDFFPEAKAVLTGNPVRAEILQAAGLEKAQGAGKMILVLGGSQGAHRVNGLMLEAFAGNVSGNTVQIRHQTGSTDEAWVRKGYSEAGVAAQVSSFISDMAAAYLEADLVVSRAGATTLAELAILGKPAILIPYPHAADDHQTTNAAFLVRGGAALMFQEQGLDGPKLREEILGLLNDAPRLQGMAARMKQYARPEATSVIVEKSMQLLAA